MSNWVPRASGGKLPCSNEVRTLAVLLVTIVVVCCGCMAAKLNKAMNRPAVTSEETVLVASNLYSKTNFATIRFCSTPSGASVFVSNEYVGTTPFTTNLPKKVNQYDLYRVVRRKSTEVAVPPTAMGADEASIIGGPFSIAAMIKARKKGATMTQHDALGKQTWYFPEETLSRVLVGRRETARFDERPVEFRLNGLTGRMAMCATNDDTLAFDFATLRIPREITCRIDLGVPDARLVVAEPAGATCQQAGNMLVLRPTNMAQDGAGKWWKDGVRLEDSVLSVRLLRNGGQWIPRSEPLRFELPSQFCAGPMTFDCAVPLKAIPWSWKEHSDWPPVGERSTATTDLDKWLPMLREQADLRDHGQDASATGFVSSVLLRALSTGDERVRLGQQLRSYVRRAISKKPGISIRTFQKIDPATDAALAFEIQEDTARALRDAHGQWFDFVDSFRTGDDNSLSNATMYSVQVDIVGLSLETQEKIARKAGKVQVGYRRIANPEYYDLVKARVASTDALARLSAGSIVATSDAEKQQGDAVTRLVIGGALAQNGALSPADSGNILLGAVATLFEAGSDRAKADAFNVQAAAAKSTVEELTKKLSSTAEYFDEPIYQEFHVEDRYVVKKALATAYVHFLSSRKPEKEVFSRKIIADITVADTLEEENPALGKKGHALDLPSDQQMKRDVAMSLVKEILSEIKEGFLNRIGLEYYARAKLAVNEADADRFASNAVQFLVSPAARAYKTQTLEIYDLLDGLMRRATRGDVASGVTDLFSDAQGLESLR